MQNDSGFLFPLLSTSAKTKLLVSMQILQIAPASTTVDMATLHTSNIVNRNYFLIPIVSSVIGQGTFSVLIKQPPRSLQTTTEAKTTTSAPTTTEAQTTTSATTTTEEPTTTSASTTTKAQTTTSYMSSSQLRQKSRQHFSFNYDRGSYNGARYDILGFNDRAIHSDYFSTQDTTTSSTTSASTVTQAFSRAK